MTNSMETIINLANQVAAKNDRWLFIATLLIFGIAVFLAFRWLVSKYEKLVGEQRIDQQRYTASLININAESNRMTRGFLLVLEKNTSVIEANTIRIEQCRMVSAPHPT